MHRGGYDKIKQNKTKNNLRESSFARRITHPRRSCSTGRGTSTHSQVQSPLPSQSGWTLSWLPSVPVPLPLWASGGIRLEYQLICCHSFRCWSSSASWAFICRARCALRPNLTQSGTEQTEDQPGSAVDWQQLCRSWLWTVLSETLTRLPKCTCEHWWC